MSKEQPLEKLASANVIASLRSEIEQTSGNPADVEREMRTRIEALHWEIFTNTQSEVTKRWTYESVIKRPYYHVTELDDEQLTNWGKYLDYEEAEGDYERTKFLYERCLVTAANYDEIWFRYARWLAAQEGKHEEVRNVYQRASSIFVAIAKPAIRLHYANFEESQGRFAVAIAIHEAILMHIPSHLETIKSLVNLHRRQYGVDSAIEVLRKYTEDGDCTQQTRGALVAEWARILWRSRDDSTGARELFESTQNQFLDSQPFWSSWLLFEIDQPANQSEEAVAPTHPPQVNTSAGAHQSAQLTVHPLPGRAWWQGGNERASQARRRAQWTCQCPECCQGQGLESPDPTQRWTRVCDMPATRTSWLGSVLSLLRARVRTAHCVNVPVSTISWPS
jgi:pre-mRNA-processing factor 39